ncbi:class I SAM-dependent DNA methyltransferase [Mesoterricola sediminis]|uniref:Methyltransferase n=1 Tax=Mesoterricola sediminis TaxID=2927980 RepID=A0AA48H173_9BACT|nr:class I SAM-dependent methyltransferase [Mesoterricola sediminis]BDU77747.1 methyltransferase [Mesoterricola sediminis]
MEPANRFDAAAATWDQEDRRVVLAREVTAAILDRVRPEPAWRALDFGAGTGLVTLALAPHVGRMTGADTSEGMLAQLAAKAGALGLPVEVRRLDGAGDLGGPYDLIVSSMTLHHVVDVPALLVQLARHLAPGGRIALADLEPEDGSFHGEDASDVHHLGFEPADIAAWLEAAGLRDVAVARAVETTKKGRTFGIFLATGRAGA